MAAFPTKRKTKSETSSSTLKVQFKEVPNEDVCQDETLSEVIAVLETNDYNSKKTRSPYSSHDFRTSVASAT
jgi:hypothetical protein